MAERRAGFALGLAVFALLLVAACWHDGGGAGVLAWLSQAPMALAIALLRGSRVQARLGRDALGLALLWGAGFLAAAVLVAWPLWSLRSGPATLWSLLIFLRAKRP